MPSKAELRQEWNNAGKDVVVLHQFDRAKTRPNPSPYCLKLETFLRVAAIEYKIDTTQPMGPKGKAPWITFNGTDYNDSQHCIELLMEKLEDKNIDKELSANQAAQARAVRIMFEDHFSWCFNTWQMTYNQAKFFKGIMAPFPVPGFLQPLVWKQFIKQATNQAKAQGIGRHSKEEVERIGMDDLRAASAILGNKAFLFGDKPCVADVVVWTFVCEILTNDPADDSPWKKELEKEDGDLKNLKDHFERIKEKYWENWDDFMYKAPEKPKKEEKKKEEKKDEDKDKEGDDKKDEDKKEDGDEKKEES